jgi:uncharacterized membrane protein
MIELMSLLKTANVVSHTIIVLIYVIATATIIVDLAGKEKNKRPFQWTILFICFAVILERLAAGAFIQFGLTTDLPEQWLAISLIYGAIVSWFHVLTLVILVIVLKRENGN